MLSFNIAKRMKICLKKQVKVDGAQKIELVLENRLPKHIEGPCYLTCEYQVEPGEQYYLLTITIQGELSIVCQRCLGVFKHHYLNTSKLAACTNDDVAERMLEHFESTVAINNQIDLSEIVTDDLYLFSPEKHVSQAECDSEISQLIVSKDISII